MTSDRTIDLVKHAEAYHRTLQKYYRKLRGEAEQTRVQMALDYLIQHEASMESALRDYEKHVPENVAARWFKYSPNEALEQMLAEKEVDPKISIGDLSTWVTHLNEGLIRYYQQFVEASWPEPVQEVMERLLEMEREEQKRTVRALQEQAG